MLRGALQAPGERSDGLILVDTLQPYWVPPFKFKTDVTSDFLLESESRGEGYVLLVHHRNAPPQPFLRGGQPCKMHLTPAQKRRLGLGGLQYVHRSNGVIVECRVRGGAFVPVRRRNDRRRPNSRATVEDNLMIQEAGCTKARWLFLGLRCAPEHEVFQGWTESLLRVLQATLIPSGSVVLQLGRLPPRQCGRRVLRMGSPLQEPECGFGCFARARAPRADFVLCLWCLGDFEDLDAFASAARDTEARAVLCVYWKPLPASSLGRFALCVHGSKITVQVAPDPQTRTTGVVDEAALCEAMGRQAFEEQRLEAPLPKLRRGGHSLHADYEKLAEAVAVRAFARAFTGPR